MEKSFLTLPGLLVSDPLLLQEERKDFCIWKEWDFQEERVLIWNLLSKGISRDII